VNLEPGEYFAVTRGHKHGDTSFFDAVITGSQIRPQEVTYDRHYEGLIFMAVEVCGCMVAGNVLATTTGYKKDMVGHTYSLNLTEIEAMSLTRKYVAAIIGEEAEKRVHETGKVIAREARN